MEYSVREMIESSPALKSTTPVYTDNFALTIGGVLNIYNDLTKEDCELIIGAKRFSQIQFAGGKLKDETLKHINETLLPSRQNICLSIEVNASGAFDNLDFLSKLPNLKNLAVNFFKTNEVEKINKYLNLNVLAIGTQKVSLKPIIQQTGLKRLFISEQPKGIEIIGQMPWIENLTFSMQALKNLDFLSPLSNLKELHFLLGGTKNLSNLPNIGKIEKLSFMRVRQLMVENLLPINEMKYLKEVTFDTQTHLTDLDWLKDKRIKTEVINCKNFKR
ncbi:MAG TPA: hypothetical protein VG367_08015 [Mucilaginibacter sp.]|jgi:hypothetical protein|nr:hypothetical protein [Mucilaginibacter sp.]